MYVPHRASHLVASRRTFLLKIYRGRRARLHFLLGRAFLRKAVSQALRTARPRRRPRRRSLLENGRGRASGPGGGDGGGIEGFNYLHGGYVTVLELVGGVPGGETPRVLELAL